MKQRCRWTYCLQEPQPQSNYCAKHLPHAERKYKAYTALYENTRQERDKTFLDFYASSEWRQFRKDVLDKEPVCRRCTRAMANTVHHIVSLKADWSRRTDRTNVEPLCSVCHSRHELQERNEARRMKGSSNG